MKWLAFAQVVILLLLFGVVVQMVGENLIDYYKGKKK